MYQRDYKRVTQDSITISAKSTTKDKKIWGSNHETQPGDAQKLLLFKENNVISGFGWMHESSFFFAQYAMDVFADSDK